MTQELSERDYCLALSCLRFLSPVRIRALHDSYSSPLLVTQAPVEEIAALLKLTRSEASLVKDPLDLPEVVRQVERTSDFIAWTDADYPSRLKEIGDAPFAIRFRGRRELLAAPAVAVVGSRSASPYAKNVAFYVADQLARQGLTVVSGLARGIDACAHQAALDAGGATLAVLGTSLDITYPRENGRLMEQIGERGLLLSEFPDPTRACRPNFPIRNRLIAGISLGVVIVEAGERSGSLITARLAIEQGREVFAAPGSIFSPGSVGPHRLIQDGAKLLHSIDDLFDELLLVREVVDKPAEPFDSPLLTFLSCDEPLHTDVLRLKSGMSFGDLATALLELENEGVVDALPGGRYVRRSVTQPPYGSGSL